MAAGGRCRFLGVMPSPCTKYLTFAGLGTAITIAVLLVVRKPQEPVTGGKPLGYWFHELPGMRVGPGKTVETMGNMTFDGVFGGTYGSQRVKPSVSTAAIREIGSNADRMSGWERGLAFPTSKKQNLLPDRIIRHGMV
jgi:hypothetical protein